MNKILISLILSLFLAMQPIMAQEAPSTTAQPLQWLSWYKSLRAPKRKDLLQAKRYVNSKWRCLRHGEGCSRKERNTLRMLAVAAGVTAATIAAQAGYKQLIHQKEQRKKTIREQLASIESTQKTEKKEFDEQSIEVVKLIAKCPSKPSFLSTKSPSLEELMETIESGINPNVFYQGNTALTTAALCNSLTLVDKLLSLPNINVNMKNDAGNTALAIAVIRNNVDMVQSLLKAGSNPNIADGDTPLMLAIQDKKQELVSMLLKAGADPNKGNKAKTPLIIAIAAEYPNLTTIQTLIDNGAEVNAQNNLQETALTQAIESELSRWRQKDVDSLLKVIQILRTNNADPNLTNSSGKTAYDVLSYYQENNAITSDEHRELKRTLEGRFHMAKQEYKTFSEGIVSPHSPVKQLPAEVRTEILQYVLERELTPTERKRRNQ